MCPGALKLPEGSYGSHSESLWRCFIKFLTLPHFIIMRSCTVKHTNILKGDDNKVKILSAKTIFGSETIISKTGTS